MILTAAAVGLLTGWLVNAVADRVPAGRPVLRLASRCHSCGLPIEARDNLPLVSWALLAGRCRHCRRPIPLRYPLVEAGSAALFAAAAVVIGLEWYLPAYLWFAALSLALVVTDLDAKRIPNRILYPGTAVAAALLAAGSAASGDLPALARAFIGGLGYFIGLLVPALAARGSFGFGDVKLAFLLGLFSAHRSWEALVASVFAAFVLGGLAAIWLLATGRSGRKDTIAFGPAMVVGAWVGIALPW